MLLITETLLILRYVSERRKCKYLRNLLKEVIEYNEIVKLINLKDNLIDLGHEIKAVNNRNKIVKALIFTRDDLVKALKTERILRELEKISDCSLGIPI